VEVGRLDLAAIHLGAVAALQVEEPAQRRVDFDHEVHARKVRIIGQGEVGVRRPAHQEGIVLGEGERLAAVRSLGDGQRHAEAVGRSAERLGQQRTDPGPEVGEAAPILVEVGLPSGLTLVAQLHLQQLTQQGRSPSSGTRVR
jgi:hypothetical protein